MQDIRIRICAAAVLCISAFISIYGAAAALLWWTAFTPRLRLFRRFHLIGGMVAMIGVVSLLIQFSGESGVSYFFKMTVILLTGVWLAGEYNPGEFLNLGTWFLGNRTGFELGLLSEMAMQSFSSLFEDLDRIRLAFSFKGTPLNARTIIPAGTLLIYLELARAKDNADLLAVRGYRHGGTLQPAFKTPKKDIIAGLCAIPVLPIAIFPLVNFLYFNSVVLRGLI